MKKIILLFLILFLIPQIASAEGVSKVFNVGPGESVNVYIYRLDGQVNAEFRAYPETYAVLSDFVIRQNGWEYIIISDFLFNDGDGESVFSVSFGDKIYVTIGKGFSEDSDLNLSKEFDLVNTARIDKEFLTVPAKKSSGGGGGGCFILNLVK